MARDLIPPNSPAGRPTTPDGTPNLIELPPEPPRSGAEPAQVADLPPSEYRNRFGFVMGHGGSLPKLLLPVRLGVGGRLGTGRQTLSWVHVRDVVRGMAHVWNLAAVPAGGAASPQVYNFTAPGALSQEDFMRTAAAVLHRPFWLPTPAAPVRLALGEQADILLEGQRVAPAHLLATGFRFRFPDARSALQDLC